MYSYIFIALFIVSAYLLQILFSLKQIRHFNESYKKLRRQGKVAIGRKSGKIQAGAICMFAVEEDGTIIDGLVMQGVSVVAKFKEKKQYIGENITHLTKQHPLVLQENKRIRESMIEAKNIYIKVNQGEYKEVTPISPILMIKIQVMSYVQKFKNSPFKN